MELDIIQNNIFEIRGQRIMLDVHLAELFEVETRTLKQNVRRNIERFPIDFMFQLTKKEWNDVITNCDNLPNNSKFSPNTPFAFTEQGVAMLSGILRSKKAINVNIEIMRAFVMLRKIALKYSEITEKIDLLEAKYDEQFAEVFSALKYLLEPPKSKRTKIGYKK